VAHLAGRRAILRTDDTDGPPPPLTLVVESCRKLGLWVGICALLTAGTSGAAPTTVTLEGLVTESLDAAYSPGDPLQLTLDYSSDFVSWWNGGSGSRAVRAELVVGDPVADLPGIWTRAEVRIFDTRTGQELPPSTPPGFPFATYQLDVALEAEAAPDALHFSGVLRWPPPGFPADLDGTEFLEHFEGGEVALVRGGTTVLRGHLVPEPSTALLTASGLVFLGRWGRRRRND
jgi:hypothetical protein